MTPLRTRGGAKSFSVAPPPDSVIETGRWPNRFSRPSRATRGSRRNSARRIQISVALEHDLVRDVRHEVGLARPPYARNANGRLARAAAFRDETDLAVRLQNGPAHLLERADLLAPCLRGDLLLCQAVAPDVLLDHVAVLDQDHGLTFQDRAQDLEPPGQVREEDRERPDGSDREHQARDGEVVLGDTLLNEVADRDEQDEIERLERVELAPSDDPRQEKDEQERNGCSEDDVHSSGEDGDRPVDGGQERFAVVERDVLRAAPDVRRIHLLLEKEDV